MKDIDFTQAGESLVGHRLSENLTIVYNRYNLQKLYGIRVKPLSILLVKRQVGGDR